MNDTDPHTEAIYREMLMARTPEERFLMGIQMCASARATVIASLPAGLSPLKQKIALLRRYYGSDFTERELLKIEDALRLSATRASDISAAAPV